MESGLTKGIYAKNSLLVSVETPWVRDVGLDSQRQLARSSYSNMRNVWFSVYLVKALVDPCFRKIEPSTG